MAIRPHLLSFTVGFAAGVVVTRKWPEIQAAARPLLTRVRSRARRVLDRSRGYLTGEIAPEPMSPPGDPAAPVTPAT